jgi:hypothetical protein
MRLCELCDRPLPTLGRCACRMLGEACDAVSAFGAFRPAADELPPPKQIARPPLVTAAAH